ncbi:SGNH/GDSL hydrolase family protein [Gordonia polyisoprenivorans]|uniref:SGNH/GDSL hydrolase family protein n=1 Tax=Gordonia polyisoprenivorans TaxID=84595 RepID=A0A846WPJ5_9ACTN|nr:SGNH/GDSL hydrolase family protein [Gordonia polyisoprenivorans]
MTRLLRAFRPRPTALGRPGLRRTATAVLGATTALALIGAAAGTAAADPADDVAGALSRQLTTGSSELGLSQLLPMIPGLGDLLRQGGAPGTTRCTSVVQIGDSTSVGVDSPTKVPSPAETLSAQYKRVGVGTVDLDANRGRSIVGAVDGRPNAAEAVATHLARGERGCWVIAMGLEDAADIAKGSTVAADERIDRIMNQLRGQPVLWPTVTADAAARGYTTTATASFNNALRRAVVRYPNLAVYDWAAAAAGQPEWFDDGIHYTAAGIAARNMRFAGALATAFPPGTGVTPATKWVSN